MKLVPGDPAIIVLFMLPKITFTTHSLAKSRTFLMRLTFAVNQKSRFFV
jgi:hypothetical protein